MFIGGREKHAQVVFDAGLPGRQQALLHRGAAARQQVGQYLDLALDCPTRSVVRRSLRATGLSVY